MHFSFVFDVGDPLPGKSVFLLAVKFYLVIDSVLQIFISCVTMASFLRQACGLQVCIVISEINGLLSFA